MTLDLTDQEQKCLTAALLSYSKMKGAERMLEGQKNKDNYPKYDRLLTCVKGIQGKLTT